MTDERRPITMADINASLTPNTAWRREKDGELLFGFAYSGIGWSTLRNAANRARWDYYHLNIAVALCKGDAPWLADRWAGKPMQLLLNALNRAGGFNGEE